MNKRTKALIEEATLLPASERLDVVEQLLQSLDQPDKDIDREWVEEADRRFDAYLAGSVTAIDAKDVLAKYLKP